MNNRIKNTSDKVLENLMKSYTRVFNHIRRFIGYKYSLDHHTAEDIASRAILYALKPALERGLPPPPTPDDLEHLAIWKAKLLVIDLSRYNKRHPLVLLDEDPEYHVA